MDTQPHLGALPAPAWHRPWLRYVDPVDGATVTPPAEPVVVEPTATAEPAEPVEPSATPPWGDDFDPERAWKKIQAQKADLEAEKGKRAQAIKDAETAAEKRAAEKAYKDIGKTLGVVTEDETPTVEGLSQALQDKDATLTAAQAETQTLRIENAILRHADRFGGDVDALTDSESFKAKLKALDPTADDHASQVEALVKSTVESNARYRKVQVAASNTDGNPITPPPTPGPVSIDDRRKALRDRRSQ